MRNKEKDEAQIAEKQKRILEVGFTLFASEGIESVTMPRIAEESGVGRASLYRYYSTKMELLVAISAWVWKSRSFEMYEKMNPKDKTAAQELEYFIESFIDLYRNHRDILRFNQFFNVYLATQGETDVKVEPFTEVIDEVEVLFHDTYQKGKVDGTIRTDISEQDMYKAIVHLMLAVVTRYAVGLVYGEKAESEKELILLKSLLTDRYIVSK